VSKKILLGFEINTGKKVEIEPSHLIVTGLTQKSGKTTTLEALITRSGLKAIAFRTKINETGFSQGAFIPPYFRERFDWEYVQSVLEAIMKEKLKFQRSWIIRACETAQSLTDVAKNIDESLKDPKIRSLDKSVLIELQAFFRKILPLIAWANFSRTLELKDGLNIMDLVRFPEQLQGLVIDSVLEQVLKHENDTIVIVPEAWKYIPQGRNTPVKLSAEEFIRQAAASNNFLWIDSQDITGVDKTPLKQISTWILGYQSERNEVKHTIEQMPLPSNLRPEPDEIMTLEKGHFYCCTEKFVKKVYALPSWLSEEKGIEIAKGKLSVSDVKRPDVLVPFVQVSTSQSVPSLAKPEITTIDIERIKKEISDMRIDFFDSIKQLQDFITNIGNKVMELTSRPLPSVNTDEVVGLVLQKIKIQPQVQSVDMDAIVSEVLKRVPKMGMTTSYSVEPLEKIKKDFLEEAKNLVLKRITTLDDEQKKMLKYVESLQSGQKLGTIIEKCLFKTQTSGGTRKSVGKKIKTMVELEVVRYDSGHSLYYPNIIELIKKFCEQHEITEQEIKQVYNHILMEILK
jgi:hypothetical protein